MKTRRHVHLLATLAVLTVPTLALPQEAGAKKSRAENASMKGVGEAHGKSAKKSKTTKVDGSAPAGFSDEDVTAAVEREFFNDFATPSHAIDVTTRDGIVTLEGQVRHLMAKERSARIAETVKGVRAVINRIEVAPVVPRDDAEIVQDVRMALLEDSATESFEVTVQSRDGHVILSGDVDSWTERRLCGKVAKATRGVTGYTDELRVVSALDRPDGEIEREIEQAMKWNVLLDHALVSVDVDDGAVTLGGVVGSAAEKRQALQDAWTAGVHEVDDSGLDVARWARDEDLRKDKYAQRPDGAVGRAVQDALARDPRVLSFNVDVAADSGVVTLRGVVDNLKARRAAEQVAGNTVGTISVRNYLKVRPAVERSAADIRADVLAAFLRDPWVDSDLIVTVDDGTVYLHGGVDSKFVKGQADDLAARVKGVTDVVNGLRVESGPYTYDPYVDDWDVYAYDWYEPTVVVSHVDDRRLLREVRDELFWSPFVDRDEVAVEVDDGTVTLRGTVDSWMEKGAARDNAYEAGAVYVRNLLDIASSDEDGIVQ